MNAVIRFGLEADIVAVMPGELTPEAIDVLRSYGRTVLSFSNRVRNLPDESEFGFLLRELDIVHKPDELEGLSGESHEGVYIPATRLIEVVNPEIVDIQTLKLLGDAMVGLARDKGSLGRNGALFLDHTTLPEGIVISCYDPLSQEIS